jgi:hypothetical protein
MNAPARIFLGDLVRALSLAGTRDSADWPAIMGMLGLQRAEPSAPSVIASPPQDRPPVKAAVEEPIRADSCSPARVEGDGDIGQLLEFDLERSTAPAETIAFDAPTPAPARSLNRLPFLSLFDALGERGILIEAAGMPCAEGPLAVLQAVNMIARGDALHDLPREKIQSVSKGCQILLDTGIGMQPFATDGRQLTRSLRKAVGTGHTELLTFVDCPTGGVMTEQYRDETYVPPRNGSMVLAISDLCQGGPRSAIREAESEDWLTAAKSIQDAGSSLVVLNPYPSVRWPTLIAGQIPIVYWDTATKAADVRRTRRRFRT